MENLHKVWEIKALVRKPSAAEAQKMLEKIAKQVQPIMRNRCWRVKRLSEFCPKNPSLLGVNVGSGIDIKLRLRRANRDLDFIPYDEVLDTMLHELCHNVHSAHNASFYSLWDELRKECEGLISKGISGTGEGFDRPGKRLGGFSRQPPLPALQQATMAAAQKRAKLNDLMPSGANRLGGDSSLMAALSPTQAAAMAAERRLNDEIWCGSQFSKDVDSENLEEFLRGDVDHGSRETNFDGSTLYNSNNKKLKVEILSDSHGDIQTVNSPSPVIGDASDKRTCRLDETGFSDCASIDAASVTQPSTSNGSGHKPQTLDESNTWECKLCTFMNPPHAPLCALCCTKRSPDHDSKHTLWSCKFCTLENHIKIDKCLACDQWRFSYGPSVSTSRSNVGGT